MNRYNVKPKERLDLATLRDRINRLERLLDKDLPSVSVAASTPTPAKNSIELDGGELQLVGDEASPGADQLYSTNGGGDRGWYSVFALPLGESNTASNVGAGGVGLFDQKTGAVLEFRNIAPGSGKVTVTLDDPNSEIDIDLDESSIDHDLLLNFSAAEHIDWAITGAETVHVDRIAVGAVTQHQAALSITESQISDLSHTAEVNDLTAAVTWANVPDANVTQTSVTQHQAALSITESQVSDLGAYLDEAAHDALPSDNPHGVTLTQAVTADSGTDITAAELELLTDGTVDLQNNLHSHGIPRSANSDTSFTVGVEEVNTYYQQSGSTGKTLTFSTTGDFPVDGVMYVMNFSTAPVSIVSSGLMIGTWVVPGAQKTYVLTVQTIELPPGSFSTIIRAAPATLYVITQGSAPRFNICEYIDNTDSPYAATELNDTILCDPSAGPIEIDMPQITSGYKNRVMLVVDQTGDAATNNITIDPYGTDTIQGGATYVIDQAYGSVTLVCDPPNTDWLVVAESLLPDSAIDHDALLNFVAAEHIDWSVTGAEDIHRDRVPAPTLVFDGTLSSATQNTNAATDFTWNDATEHADITHTDGDSVISVDVAGWYNFYFNVEVTDAGTTNTRVTWAVDIEHLNSASVSQFIYAAASSNYVRGAVDNYDSGLVAGHFRIYLDVDEKVVLSSRVLDTENSNNNYADDTVSYLRIMRE